MKSETATKANPFNKITAVLAIIAVSGFIFPAFLIPFFGQDNLLVWALLLSFISGISTLCLFLIPFSLLASIYFKIKHAPNDIMMQKSSKLNIQSSKIRLYVAIFLVICSIIGPILLIRAASFGDGLGLGLYFFYIVIITIIAIGIYNELNQFNERYISVSPIFKNIVHFILALSSSFLILMGIQSVWASSISSIEQLQATFGLIYNILAIVILLAELSLLILHFIKYRTLWPVAKIHDHNITAQ